MRRIRIALLSTVALSTVALCALATPAYAADPLPSTATASVTSAHPGDTFTVTEEIHNPTDFVVTSARAALYAKETPLTGVLDLLSCTGSAAPCYDYLSSFRGPAGDLAPGETRSVTFTFRVKDTAPAGTLTLQDQFVGDNYAFDVYDGPSLAVTGGKADLAVSMTATRHPGLDARVDYALTVSNAGPATATGIRLAVTAPKGYPFVAGAGCAKTSTCAISTLAVGAKATVHYSLKVGLLNFGRFTTSAHLAGSSPADPNVKNDTASRTCTAVTGLYLSC